MQAIKEKLKNMLGKTKPTKQMLITQSLSGLGGLDAIKQSTLCLNELSEDANISYLEYLECLYLIERNNTQQLQDLLAKRLSIKLFNKELGVQMDNVVYPYYRKLFVEYTKLTEKIANLKEPFFENQSALAELLVRNLNAVLNMCMWRYYDDQMTPQDSVLIMNKLFKYAEFSSVLSIPVTLEQHAKPIHFADLYVISLMMGTLQKSNYLAKEVNLTYQILLLWCRENTLERAYAKQRHFFYVNLNVDYGADTVRAFERTADYRYWSMEQLIINIEDYLCAIETNSLTQHHKLAPLGSVTTLHRLLKKLNQDWSPKFYKRQRRNSERIKVEKTIFVSQGLTDICKELSSHLHQDSQKLDKAYLQISNSSDILMDFSDVKNALNGQEQWVIVDESDTGFGVNLGRNPSNWIEVGKLIGCLHPRTPNEYVVSEIKSVKKQKNGTYRAGLQILTTESQVLKLKQVQQKKEQVVVPGIYLDEQDDQFFDAQVTPCLYIPSHAQSEHIKPTLILPTLEYQRNRQMKVELDGVEKVFVLGQAIDVHPDWVRASVSSIAH